MTQRSARRKSLIGRIIDKLHLSKSYLPGHIKGEVDQIIHSRKSSRLLNVRQAYAFIAVNEYCSGYGKVAAIENLDPDFSMYVFSESMFPPFEQNLSLGTCLRTVQSRNLLIFPYKQAILTAKLSSRYRKFGWLRNYALLHLQDELAALQHQLVEHDKWEFRDGEQKRLVSRRLDYERPDSVRREIVASVHSKLKEYGTLTGSFQSVLVY